MIGTDRGGKTMELIIKIMGILVALEFMFIMYLETFATTSQQTGKTFHMTKNDLTDSNVQLLLKNQGIYNGLIGMAILYAVFVSKNMSELLLGIMMYIILVALYGTISSKNISIFFKQSSLAVILLVLLLLS